MIAYGLLDGVRPCLLSEAAGKKHAESTGEDPVQRTRTITGVVKTRTKVPRRAMYPDSEDAVKQADN